MAWITRPDSEQRCPGDQGGVSDDEVVVRNATSSIADRLPFSRSDLVPPEARKGPTDNGCGSSHGGSVTRQGERTHPELLDAAEAYAKEKAGRTSLGVQIAAVLDLRHLSVVEQAGVQVVFVYDDPRDDDPQHAVVRIDETLTRPQQGDLITDLKDVFVTITAGASDP